MFAHNPQIVRDPTDGTYLLYHIGETVPRPCVPDCRTDGGASSGAPTRDGGQGGGKARAGGEHPGGTQTPALAPVPAASACPTLGHGTSIATAASPWGPWARLPYVLPGYTNPSPHIFPNGTVLLAARAGHAQGKGTALSTWS